MSKDEDILTISTLPLDSAAPLATDARKRLAQIIEEEFVNRVSTDQSKLQQARIKVIKKFMDEQGITRLYKRFDALQDQIRAISDEVNRKGFGNVRDPSFYHRGYNKELDSELAALETTSADIQTLKNKLLARLMLATTVGEANVIMHEILGNTILPPLPKTAIAFIPPQPA